MDKNEIDKQLKTCPCCGGEAHHDSYSRKFLGISCSECKLRIESWEESNPELIIEKWNRRTNAINIQGKLKQCPCCGENAYFTEGNLGTRIAGCWRCKLTYSDEKQAENERFIDVERRVIDGWNRRVVNQT